MAWLDFDFPRVEPRWLQELLKLVPQSIAVIADSAHEATRQVNKSSSRLASLEDTGRCDHLALNEAHVTAGTRACSQCSPRSSLLPVLFVDGRSSGTAIPPGFCLGS